jgi:hypothetical protein
VKGTDVTLHPTISRIELTLVVGDGCAWTVPSTFRYEPSEPFAVHLQMTAGDYVVGWTFSRDLVADGLERPAGLGDVRVHPCLDEDGSAVVRLALSSPDGEAVLEVPAQELAQFLKESYCSVPVGSETEHLDVDAALADLLAGC